MTFPFLGAYIQMPDDNGQMISVMEIIMAVPDYDIHGKAVRREFEDRLRNDGWFYMIEYDAFIPPSTVAKLRTGQSMSDILALDPNDIIKENDQ